MPRDYLHDHPQFADLIRIVADEKGIDPALVEKDYWIMHCLHGLQQLRFALQLKGGTSLSKGHQAINRFSEDIDILIEPPSGHDVKTGRNQNKPAHIQTRRDFYDWLAQTIKIEGILKVERDTAFDDAPNYRSAGIRLNYESVTEALEGLREGVLLELGFDTVAPNTPKDISAWAYDYAADKVDVIDNRGKSCFRATISATTFVEKLRDPVSTKFRKQQAGDGDPIEFMRHYYDICESALKPFAEKFRSSSAPRPTRLTSRRASGKLTTRTSPNKTRLSFSTTVQRARSTPRRIEDSSALYYADSTGLRHRR